MHVKTRVVILPQSVDCLMIGVVVLTGYQLKLWRTERRTKTLDQHRARRKSATSTCDRNREQEVVTLRPLARLMARSGLKTRATRRILTTLTASLLQMTNARVNCAFSSTHNTHHQTYSKTVWHAKLSLFNRRRVDC